jgi:hypothetical protein
MFEPGVRKGDKLHAAGKRIRHLQAAFSSGARCCQAAVLLLCSFILFSAALATLSCGTAHATLDVTASAAATSGIPITIKVTAMYEGKVDTAINSIVEFSSSDSAASLPGYYKFTAADAGTHTWPNGVTLKTPGTQTVTATMVLETGINGTVTVTVSPSTTDTQF